MFRGNHPTRVDEKGRLKLPAEFKRLVDERYGTQFYITSKDGRRAEIYPLPEWQKIEEKLAQIPSMNPAKKKFLDRVNYYGQMAEMDAQGRVLLPRSCGKRQSWLEMQWFSGTDIPRSGQPRRVQAVHGHRSVDRGRPADIGEFGL
jgi:division/cell wall cluster transcriptional repressor MraZ